MGRVVGEDVHTIFGSLITNCVYAALAYKGFHVNKNLPGTCSFPVFPSLLQVPEPPSQIDCGGY